MSVLYVKNNGVWEPITSIKGDPGEVTQEEFEDLAGEVATLEADKADKDLSNLSEEGEKHFLNKSQITNCLLEVPQNIKLELNNGTLTLKAGSKVIVPNGAGVFDEVEITSDLTKLPLQWDNSYFLLMTNDGKLTHQQIGTLFSGNVQPTVLETYALWYDTTNNLVKFTSDKGASWVSGFSLPFALVKSIANEGYEIHQIFNGFGYIGSTIWVDKGVKCLIPNGRNEDGTLKNTEVVTSQVKIRNQTTSGNRLVVLESKGDCTTYYYSSYDTIDNYNRTDIGLVQNCAVVGSCVITNGQISDFKIKLPFRAVDYNDLDTKVNKSGDTMTGNLTVEKNSNPVIYIKSLSQDRSVAASSNSGTQYIYLVDKNNATLGSVGVERYTNGRNTIKLQAFSKDGSTAPAVRVNAYADNTIGCEFPRCTTKPTTTSTARNDLVAVVVQNYLNGTSWYRVWSDGFIEQGGFVENDGTVTLLKSFTNVYYTLVFGSTEGNGVPRIAAKTVSSFTYGSANFANCGAYWYACGY